MRGIVQSVRIYKLIFPTKLDSKLQILLLYLYSFGMGPKLVSATYISNLSLT